MLGRGRGSIGLFLQTLINGINIVLALVLGLWLGWGVAGVACGTMIGETIGAVAGLMIVLRGFVGVPGHRDPIFSRGRSSASCSGSIAIS